MSYVSSTASVSPTISTSSSPVISSSSTTSTPARPTASGPTPAYINDFNYLYCATDAGEDRTLVGKYLASGAMSLDLCALTCTGFRFFGVEYSIECFCGDTLAASVQSHRRKMQLSLPRNAAETCGGLGGLTLYTKNPVPIVSGTSSAVSTSSSVTISSSLSPLSSLETSSLSTAPTSTSLWSSLSSSFSSSQLSSSSTSSVAPSTTASSSSSISASNSPHSSLSSTTSAASSSRLSSTSKSSSSSSQSTSSSIKSSSTSISTGSSSPLVLSTTSSRAPSATASPDTWDYLGCMNDTTTARPISAATWTNTTAMTVDMCKDFCESKDYPLAGLENLGICFCGLAVKNGGTLGQIGCTATCPGDKSQFCGGSKRLNVYPKD